MQRTWKSRTCYLMHTNSSFIWNFVMKTFYWNTAASCWTYFCEPQCDVAIIVCKMFARDHLSSPMIVNEQLDGWMHVSVSSWYPRYPRCHFMSLFVASTVMEATKSDISGLKKPPKAEMLWKYLPVVVKGLPHLKRIDMFP